LVTIAHPQYRVLMGFFLSGARFGREPAIDQPLTQPCCLGGPAPSLSSRCHWLPRDSTIRLRTRLVRAAPLLVRRGTTLIRLSPPPLQKRTFTFVPRTLHTLQRVYRVRSGRVPAFHTGRRLLQNQRVARAQCATDGPIAGQWGSRGSPAPPAGCVCSRRRMDCHRSRIATGDPPQLRRRLAVRP
jgi:hypothetical protein